MTEDIVFTFKKKTTELTQRWFLYRNKKYTGYYVYSFISYPVSYEKYSGNILFIPCDTLLEAKRKLVEKAFLYV